MRDDEVGKLIAAAADATEKWEEFSQFLAQYGEECWREYGIFEHMMRNYINVDTPITLRATRLDNQNRELLRQALLRWECGYPEYKKFKFKRYS